MSKLSNDAEEKFKLLLPEGIALINIWDIAINETVRHFLAALQGHIYNNHMWLFLDLKRDLEHLDEPPEIKGRLEEGKGRRDGEVFMKWRSRLHYLVRSCKLSKDKNREKQRRRMCTIFAKHDGTFHEKLQENVGRESTTGSEAYWSLNAAGREN